MPVPQAVLDLLNSLQLTSDDPTFRNPGDLLNLKISSDPRDLLGGLLAPEILGSFNLSVLLSGLLSPILKPTTCSENVGPSPVPVTLTLADAAGFTVGGVALIELGAGNYELQPIVDVVQNNRVTVAALNFNHNGTAQPFSVQTFVPDTTRVLSAVDAATQALLTTTSQADLAAVSKAVEFAAPPELQAANINASQTAQNALPYLVPNTLTLSPKVQGHLSHVAGTLNGNVQNPLAGLTGALTSKLGGLITGSIVGNITKAVLNARPVITLTWHVRDKNGAELTAGTDFIQWGTDIAPILTFLPVFTEFTGLPGSTVERVISCDVKVKCSNPVFEIQKQVGPLTIQIPELQIPTMVAFNQSSSVVIGGVIFSPAVLLCVPAASAVTDPSRLVSQLTTIMGFLSTIGALTPPVVPPVVVNCAAAAGVIGMLLPSLAAGAANFQKGDGNKNLYWTWSWGQYSNSIGSALMVGPPGRTVRCYNSAADPWSGNYVARAGAIDITIGATGVVGVTNFGSGMPPTAIPPDSTCAAVVTGGLSNFDAVMDAYQFMPL